MPIAASMLPEFDQEMATTRKVLEGLPADRLDFRPHPKSYTMGGLATHIATLPSWGKMTVELDTFDMSPPDRPPPRAPEGLTAAQILERFDETVAAAREALQGATDETLMAPWTLLDGGKEVFKLPRVAVFRSFVMNHLIHHRAQLSLYFRLAGLKPPFIYGPPGD